jgi:DNA-binding PadR family transcriptional regulator
VSRNWPKLTPKQRLMMRDFDKARHNSMWVHFSKLSITVQRLEHEGFVERSAGDYYTLTDRGRDYLRFGMRDRAVAGAEKVTERK